LTERAARRSRAIQEPGRRRREFGRSARRSNDGSGS
jgi:hypothetical protein